MITDQDKENLIQALRDHEQYIYGHSNGIKLELHYIDFSNDHLHILRDFNIHQAKFIDCNFSKANLSDIDFAQVDFVNCNFSRANLSGSTFKDNVLTDCSFKGANLKLVDFYCTILYDCIFTFSNVQESNIDLNELVIRNGEIMSTGTKY